MRLPEGSVELLMKLQYEFPLDERPFTKVAEELGMSVDGLMGKVRRLKVEGVLKRIGFYVNYRSVGRFTALAAFASRGRWRELDREIGLEVTHSYVRDHPKYDLWVVVKGSSREEVVRELERVSRKFGVEYLLLPSKRVLRLSVKYDLLRGISRAASWDKVNPNPPAPEEVGVSREVIWRLRSLPLEVRPYKELASITGCTEGSFVDLIREMLRMGILGDPGAALDGRKIGFHVNGMSLMKDCGPLLERKEFTHVVERETPEDWPYPCYGMVHSTNRRVILDVLEELGNPPTLFSLLDLRPGVQR
ncbi:MAG: Lrp/AsnC family transcriptional regulator [Candidatus Korarchaeota archaeon]|nr:Lrp/AsnC family transcriptional regulator [Candidatus Korarchaeota archaeon]